RDRDGGRDEAPEVRRRQRLLAALPVRPPTRPALPARLARAEALAPRLRGDRDPLHEPRTDEPGPGRGAGGGGPARNGRALDAVRPPVGAAEARGAMSEQVFTPAGLDALPPPEMAEKAERIGVAKAAMGSANTFALAVLAGAFIALGAIFATTVAAGGTGRPYGVARLLTGI